MLKLWLILLFSLLTFPQSLSAKAIARTITDLGQGIYRFENDTHASIFILGKTSVLMTDPINAEAAQWLKNEIKKKHGERTVSHLIYSHNHWDHVSGGELLQGPNTVVIAHELAAQDIRDNQAPTVLPNLTFNDRMTLQFEERTIELRYHGVNNGAGNISLYVPDAKFLFVVDWIVLKRLPWMELYHYDLDGMIHSIKDVLSLDFERVAPGHSVVGTKADVREFLSYLEDLRGAVLKGMNEGRSLADLQASIKLDKYQGYAKYKEWLPLNIKGAYEQIARKSGRFGQAK